MSDSNISGEPLAAGAADEHHPRHRREGVPLDGAPDLGLYTAPAPIVSEPVNPAAWSEGSTNYVAPSPVPPEYPAPPTISEFQPTDAPPVDPADFAPPASSVAPPELGFEQFGENPDTELTG